ncbi:MAG: formate-dependent phosphoribosylglycinamide formyltransferase [Epsilonproteobacteria bacterium]|nr:phosphoribosylglycinamide formyltransferase 2 [Campylobacterota bacterium]NPA57125.1 formate-dependent phosphoribosylglycinamide formyltransferase [Campylobacterota bacterium]
MELTTPLKHNSIKFLLLGSGELGKEVAIEAQRLGIEVVAVDRYPNAPAHQVAHRSYVIDMLDREQVLDVVLRERPTYILPEIEAISIEALFEAERLGYTVIPNAEAVNKTMNRKNIRRFAAEELGLPTSRYRFVTTLEGLREAAEELGFPVVVKPVMSSSGHGQSIARSPEDLERSWEQAKEARGDASELIVEEFIDFDYEITLLTARTERETLFCEPIGHIQQDGDYIFSWQPMEMGRKVEERAKEIAKTITDGLGGRGIFGVELFIKGDLVFFSEVSPRPHDTGMVTLVTQSQSEFALHVRAILGLPLGYKQLSGGASGAYKAKGDLQVPTFRIDPSIFGRESSLRIFGKPEAHGGRRMAVVLVMGEPKGALEKARELVEKIELYDPLQGGEGGESPSLEKEEGGEKAQEREVQEDPRGEGEEPPTSEESHQERPTLFQRFLKVFQ